MDLKDQLKDLFPDHEPSSDPEQNQEDADGLWIQEEPLECKYVKRKGKVNTIISGYTGADHDFKNLAKDLKSTLGVGGSYKNDEIIIQGDHRDQIMEILKEKGFKVKRVGG